MRKPIAAAAGGGGVQEKGPRPSIKMRQLHWEKLPESRVTSTRWKREAEKKEEDEKKEEEGDASVLDWAEIERLFTSERGSAAQRGQTTTKMRKKKLVMREQVLDVQRANAIGILMTRMRLPWRDMPRAILTMNREAFQTVDDVETLMGIAPTEDDAHRLSKFLEKSRLAQRARPSLSDAEEFVLLLMTSIGGPGLSRRLKLLHATLVAPELISEVGSGVAVYSRAVAQLDTSECFDRVMRLTLTIGNYMNYGTRLGGASGFRLSTLARLKDTRSGTGEMTLLHYIVRTMMRRYPNDCVNLAADLSNFSTASMKLTLSELAEAYRKAVRQLREAEALVTSPPAAAAAVTAVEGAAPVVVWMKVRDDDGHVNIDCFENALERRARSFVSETHAGVVAIAARLSTLKKELFTLIASFGELSPDLTVDEESASEVPDIAFGATAESFIATIRAFVSHYDSAYHVLVSEAEAQAERERRSSVTTTNPPTTTPQKT